MEAIDIRNANFFEIEARLTENRASVYWALSSAGASTNKALSLRMGWTIENVRPRITELCSLGLAECVGRDGRDGIYQAVPLDVARQRHQERQAALRQSEPAADQLPILFKG